MKQKRSVCASAMVVALSLIVGGCEQATGSRTGGNNTAPVAGGTLKFGLSVEPPCLDPAYTGTIINYTVSRNVIDSLLYLEADGTLTPWLAESYKVSDDHLTYTFKIRQGVSFSNGVAFNAKAAKANLDFDLDPANATNALGILNSIKSVEAPDDATLVLHLKRVDAGLLQSLSSVRAGFIEPSKLALKDKLCQDAKNIIGTGPFIFENYRPGQNITLVRNKNYNWPKSGEKHRGPAYLDKIVYSFLPDISSRTNALQSNQVDAIDSVQSYDVPLFAGDKDFQHIVGYDTSTSFGFNLNAGKAPLDDINVRRALRDGFDADTIVTSLYKGTRTRAWSWVGSDSPYYDTSLKGSWGNKIDEANKLLDASGWTTRDSEGYRTKDGKRLTVNVEYIAEAVRDQRDTLIQSVAAALKKNIGLDLELHTPASGPFYDELGKGDYGIYPNIWTRADYGNNITTYIVNWLYRYTVKNLPADVADVAKLGQEATATTDHDARKNILSEAQRKLVDDYALFVPLTSGAFQLAATSKVHNIGFEPESLTVGSLYNVWIAK
ncbi:ABC transporter substrate-binding protein [Paraburkholderia sp. CNPSo 3155]|uniref:ABC transporter substrate-binding protein n=1 Tax=Paraburkholderia atlantica TaxID=2654982 RepID=UPI00128DB895|nr:ABC transporter substrate-binding protein [Paraburkholderia atlantica]MPW09017.1 ABC transporter substrate-binding protein [Paraburkholderia atlantica]